MNAYHILLFTTAFNRVGSVDRHYSLSLSLSLSVCVGYNVMTHLSSLLSTQLEGLLNVMETGWDGVSTGYGVMKGREGERGGERGKGKREMGEGEDEKGKGEMGEEKNDRITIQNVISIVYM